MWVSGGRAKSALPRTLAASRHETWGRLRAALSFVPIGSNSSASHARVRLCTFHPKLRATPNVSTSMRINVEHSGRPVKRAVVKGSVVPIIRVWGFCGEREVDEVGSRRTHRDDSFGAASGPSAIAMQWQVCANTGHSQRPGERVELWRAPPWFQTAREFVVARAGHGRWPAMASTTRRPSATKSCLRGVVRRKARPIVRLGSGADLSRALRG